MGTLKQDCIDHGMSYRTVGNRINEQGMSRHEALIKPLEECKRKPRLYWYLGRWMCTAALAEHRGVRRHTMSNAIRAKGLAAAMATETNPKKSHRKGEL